jgi:hypothetical protein
MVTKEIREQLNQLWTAILPLQEAIVIALAAKGPTLSEDLLRPIGNSIEILRAENNALLRVNKESTHG